MAKKYDLRTKEGKRAAEAEKNVALLGEVFKMIFFPIKLIFKFIFMLIMKIINK